MEIRWIVLCIAASTLWTWSSLVDGQAVVTVTDTAITVKEGDQFSVGVKKIGTSASQLTVVVQVLNVAASDRDDFVGSSHPVVFPAGSGEVVQSATFTTSDDSTPEKDEVFTLQLFVSRGQGTVGTPGTVTVTIMANDDAFGVFSFVPTSPLTVQETTQENIIDIEIRRDKGTYDTVAISFKVTGSNDEAKPDVDVSPATGSVVFTEGQASKMLQLKILPDRIPENDETFTVELLSASGGVSLDPTIKPSINRSAVSVVVRQNDAPVRFSQSIYRVDETTFTTSLTLTVYRGLEKDGQTVVGPVSREASVQYQVFSESALLGQDFRASNGSLSFAAGGTVSTISVQILPDDIPEVGENFTVTLADVSGEVVLDDPYVATVIINGNDDQNGILSLKTDDPSKSPSIQINEDAVTEVRGFVVVRSSGTFGSVSVQWALERSDGNPITPADQDVTPLQGTVTLDQGVKEKPIVLSVTQDAVPEAVEIYKIKLLPNTVTGGARVDGITEGRLVIEDSDNAYGLVQFGADDTQRIVINTDPRTVEMNLVRTGGALSAIIVNYTAEFISSGETVQDILDSQSPAQVVFSAGEKIKVVTLPIKDGAFLKLGGEFRFLLHGVRLVTPMSLGPFNSPKLGVRSVVSLPITSAEANGEVGFASTLTRTVDEPDGVTITSNTISFDVSRDGTNGAAVISWTLSGTGENAASVTSGDAKPMSGTVTMTSGQSLAKITIEILPDDIPEMEEELTLTLTNVTPAKTQKLKTSASQVKIVIKENDNPGGTFQFAVSMLPSYTLEEEGQPLFVTVVRIGGALVSRSVQYYVSPNGESEFYGSTNVLKFEPGEYEKNDTIVARGDGVPELTEKFVLGLRSYGDNKAVFGVKNKINITIPLNDDPFGVFRFPSENLLVHVNESSAGSLQTAELTVQRSRGAFGIVSVDFLVLPTANNTDIHPLSGTLTFQNLQTQVSLKLQAVPDNIPEENEKFQVILQKPTGGAVIGSPASSTIVILRNDDAIYFTEPSVVRVNEPAAMVFTVKRNGSANFVASVRYRTIDVTAKAGERDYIAITDALLTFGVNETLKTITVSILEDSLPETDESFYIELYNATGDVAVYGTPKATVTIAANDDANGIFRFSAPFYKVTTEGAAVAFDIIRDRGRFSEVRVHWAIFVNSSKVKVADGTDFLTTSGFVTFNDLQPSAALQIQAKADGLPEYVELFRVQLLNVTGGGPGEQKPRLAASDQFVFLEVAENDDPYGVFDFPASSRELRISEDFYPGDEQNTRANFTVERRQGTFRTVQVAWEIFSYEIAGAGNLPELRDLLFLGTIPPSVTQVPSKRRPKTGSLVLHFPGNESSYVNVSAVYQPPVTDIEDGFSVSAWLLPDENTNGYILAKTSEDGSHHYYALKVTTSTISTTLEFRYSVNDVQQSKVTNQVVAQVISGNIQDGKWHHVLLGVDSGVAEFYIDGKKASGTSALAAKSVVDDEGVLLVGAISPGEDRYTGLMQDVRIFSRKLDAGEIKELYETPSMKDVEPISGYLTYQEGETKQYITVQSIDDKEEESNEVFSVRLISARGGARVSNEDDAGILTVLKSDNANGLFGFSGPCEPQRALGENITVSCGVERERGDADSVVLSWRIINRRLQRTATSDFLSATGQLMFIPGERLKKIVVHVLDDNIPELTEVFDVVLTSVVSADGIIGTTNTSGASINPDHRSNNITVSANDYPYGFLQFSDGREPGPRDPMTLPALKNPTITVLEEARRVSLLVVRAQGLLGTVSVEWRTKDGTAKSSGKSPKDYEAGVNRLTFTSGQRFAYITITIIDNTIPEDYKYFEVELVNPTGGAAIGLGSRVRVDIRPSDFAYGLFMFSEDSRNVTALENSDVGYNTVDLKVIRQGGDLGEVTVTWFIQDDTDNDFVEKAGYVTFVPGQSSALIQLKVKGDSIAELDEDFHVILNTTSKGDLSTESNIVSNVTILANDDPYGTYIISSSSRPVRTIEINTDVAVIVERSPDSGRYGRVRVEYTTLTQSESYPFLPRGVNRAGVSDFVPASGYIVFQPNQMKSQVNVSIRDDAVPEMDETVFIRLTRVELLQGAQDRKVLNSPRLGPDAETYGQIIINQNDYTNGILELSTESVTVAENFTGSLVSVVRSAGAFGEVTVKFETVAGSASYGLDFSVTSTDVVLGDGERRKRIPVDIINDLVPENAENFTIRLLDQITGGAILGNLTTTEVIIQPSDDPQGAFGFEFTSTNAEEPPTGESRSLQVPIIRTGGTLGVVTVTWEATLNGSSAAKDVSPVSGSAYFVSNEARQIITISILPDDVPEGPDIVDITLTGASNGGRITERNHFLLTIQPNDNPHGTVQFTRPETILEERANDSTQYVSVSRIGGTYGALQVSYFTEQLDIVKEATINGQTLLSYFTSGLVVSLPATSTTVIVSAQANPLQACATACLVSQSCMSFYLNGTAGICIWFVSVAPPAAVASAVMSYYIKNKEKAQAVYSKLAVAGTDYTQVTESSVILQDGATAGDIPVTVLSDDIPELQESFLVKLKSVQLIDKSLATKTENLPSIGTPSTASVVIAANDNANGIFTIYSNDPRVLNDGHLIMVEEIEKFSVELIIERKGGSIGEVSVRWAINTTLSTATKGEDFIADGAILTFSEGETRKAVTIGIKADLIPEDDESIIIELSDPQGGAVVSDTENSVSVIIMANDNVAGILQFLQSSVLAKEGEIVSLTVSRSAPALGTVTVDWNIRSLLGLQANQRFQVSNGTLSFVSGVKTQTIQLKVLKDGQPRINQDYIIYLYNINTTGIRQTGAAALHPQNSEASITIEGGNDPHGVFSFAPTSQLRRTPEGNITVPLVLDRKFGAIGVVRVFYEVKQGSVQELSQNLVLAEALQDFVNDTTYIDVADGASSAVIPVQIIDDDIPEVEETFVVRLTGVQLQNPQNTSFLPKLASAGTLAEIIINANDGTMGEAIFPPGSARISVNETTRSLTLTVLRDKGTFGNVSVFCFAQSVGDGARLGKDFSFTSRDIHFAQGESVKLLTVQLFDDEEPEPDEQFEILLASPKGGLSLGIPSRAVITILASDAASGIVSFTDLNNITIAEPTASSSINSKVQVTLTRAPGRFGVVNVPFSVVGEPGQNVTDISPVSGFVIFQDRQDSAVLELTAVSDDEPEEIEMFSLILGQPDGGASLGKIINKFVFVQKSDSPYGLVQIFPASNRSASQMDLDETSGIIYLDIIRSLGTLGRVSVDVTFNPGTAKPESSSRLSLYPIQYVMARQLRNWYSYEAYGYTYLVMLNGERVGSFSTAVGSDGSAGSVLIAAGHHSLLYRWQGALIPVQTIETDNAMKAISFQMSEAGQSASYLFIVNYGSPPARQGKCRLYHVQNDGSLAVVQDLESKSSTDAAFFTKNGNNMLIVTNYEDGNETSINSDIYTWDSVTRKFGLSAHVATMGAMAVEVFDIAGVTYMAVANYVDSITRRTEINSAIHKLDTNGRFAVHQQIPTKGARDLLYFTMNSQSYLVIANGRSNAGSVALDVVIYLWDVNNEEFKPIQTLQANQIRAIHSYVAGSDSRRYLVIANTGSNSAIYSWEAKAQAFNLTWTGSRAYDLYPVVIKQASEDLTVLAEANYIRSNLTSTIYRATYDDAGDYIPGTTTVSFLPGQTHVKLAATVLDDNIPENTEDFTALLVNPTGGADIGTHSKVQINIQANDNAFGLVEFAQDSRDLKKEELPDQDNSVQLNVVRGQGTFGRVVVRWVATGDHDGINDLMPIQGKVEFADGQSVATISISIRDDGVPELSELTLIALTEVVESGTKLPGQGAKIGEHNTANLTVMPSDSPHGVVSWSPTSRTSITQEPATSASSVSMRVIREQGTVGNIRVYYITERDTRLAEDEQAVSGRDYVAKQSSVDMKDGQLTADVDVVILADDQPEKAESFLVRITAAQLIGQISTPGAGPSVKPTGSVAKVTIAENDNARGVISFGVNRNTAGVVETYEGTVARLRVVRSQGYFGSVSVTWQASPQDAEIDDFSPSVGSITFKEGQKEEFINISITDDQISEDREAFVVRLMRVMTGGASLGSDKAVTVSIIKNDSPNGMFSFPINQLKKTVREAMNSSDPAGVVTFDVIRTQGSLGLVTVKWRLEEKAASEFVTPSSGELIFQPGDERKTIILQTKPDDILEGEERYAITLLTADNNGDISPTAREAMVIILPDAGASGSVSILPQFSRVYIGEPVSGYDGTASVVLTRGVGVYGEIRVTWQIFRNDITAFVQTQGDVTFQDRQQTQTIILQARDDTTPEPLETFTLELTSAIGAEVNASASRAEIVYVASDYPHGLFEFSQPASVVVLEDTSPVSVRVVRNFGTSGKVEVTYITSPGSASEDKDYEPRSGVLTFNHNEYNKVIQIPILKDTIPEGPEQFYVNLTKVEMISPSIDTGKVGKVQKDMEPAIGPLSVKTVIIDKNDNAEGTIQFSPEAANFRVSEEGGTAAIPVIRTGGTYGIVGVQYMSRNMTATPNVDYRLTDGQVSFQDGQSSAFINVTIINDEEREFPELFQVILTAATGGAQLGNQKTSTVTIGKSDYPNGNFGFKGQTELVIPNPGQLRQLSLTIQRTGGLRGQQLVKWRIMGPNNPSEKLADTTDVSYVGGGQELTFGSLTWADGEGGEKLFMLTVKPHGDKWEIQKEFVVIIEDIEGFPASIGNGEASPTHKIMKLTILKYGQPNGVIQFSGISQQKRVFRESAGTVVFPIYRVNGTMGEQRVVWKVIRVNSDSGVSTDITPAMGLAVIPAEQRNGVISLQILDEDEAELTESFRVMLVRVEGGADIDPLHNTADFDIEFSDYPHGRFGVLPENQNVIVSADLERQVLINVTRRNGLFGKVVVNYVIAYDLAVSGEAVIPSSGQIKFSYDQAFSTSTLRVNDSAFLQLGSTFTVTLTTVLLLGEKGVDQRPEIIENEKTAKIGVPQLAANSEIGFSATIVNLDEVTGKSSVTIYRWGSYGVIEVDWTAGFLSGQIPAGFNRGSVLPPSGTVMMQNGQDSLTVNVTVQRSAGRLELFGVHLPRTPVSHSKGGTARLRNSNKQALIEPYGIIGFAPNSRQISVLETQKEVALTVVRAFGAYREVQVNFTSSAGTAQPLSDYLVTQSTLIMQEGVITTSFLVKILLDDLPEDDEYFHVKLTSVAPRPRVQPPWVSPRLSDLYSVATINISKNNDPFGVLAITGPSTSVSESVGEVTLTVERIGSTQGTVRVTVKTVEGGDVVPVPATGEPQTIAEALYGKDPATRATGGQDYDLLQQTLIFNATGPQTQQVKLRINQDQNAEADETVYVYLADLSPAQGARIARPARDTGRKGWAEVIIARNDLWNGFVGFADRSLQVTADEDKGLPAQLIIKRSSALDKLTVFWTAKLTPQSATSEGIAQYLVQTSGAVTCGQGQIECPFQVYLRDDQVSRNASTFYVELSVGKNSGAQANNSIARVTILANDYPNGLVQFAEGSLIKNIDRVTQDFQLEVERVGFDNKFVTVSYSTLQLASSISELAGVRVYQAISGADFKTTSGSLTFKPGEKRHYIDISVEPSTASSNPYPKVFLLTLSSPTSNAELTSLTSTSRVIITETAYQTVWKLWPKAQQKLDNSSVIRLMEQLEQAVQQPLTSTQLTVTESILNKVISAGESGSLSSGARSGIMGVFCKLLDSKRTDSTRGRWQLIQLFERFTFTHLDGVECERSSLIESPGCTYVKFSVARWKPMRINNYKYQAQNGDFFQLPENMVAIPSANQDPATTCKDIHFIEYGSVQWFRTSQQDRLLNDKVIAVGIKGRPSGRLTEPVVFKVHTPDQTVAAKKAECVYYDDNEHTWTSGSGSSVCTVNNNLALGIENYVECSCKHMSSYAVISSIRNPDYIGYPIWFHISCFVCMAGLALTILSHHMSSSYSLFSASLIMHMCFACLATQICYVIDAFLSPSHILNLVIGASNYRCIVMSLFLHYFFTAQFTWMMAQAINLWKILVLNDEHTDRLYVLFFILGWVLPALIVACFYIVTYSLYRFVFFLPSDQIYGDLSLNGDICFVTNPYVGLAGVLGPALVCLIVVGIIFIQVFQVTSQWLAYDDIYRGKYNINEVRALLGFWAVIILTWLWGGLHMAYGHLWMLILFCIFNIVQGLYAFVVYMAVRNPCNRQQKASYSVNVPDGPEAAYHITPLHASLKGSRASLINDRWEKDSVSTNPVPGMQVKRSPSHNGNIYITNTTPYGSKTPSIIMSGGDDFESTDFDDLIFALKTGGGYPVSEASHPIEREIDIVDPDSKYEMRRISIADTHL